MKEVVLKIDPRDPPVRKSGRCRECRKERPPMAVKHADPFCSAECCREWYWKHVHDRKGASDASGG